MKETAPETISITSIEFIFRRPWIFISSVVVIMSLVHAKVSLDPLEYKSNAVLSFEMAGETLADKPRTRELDEIKTDLVSKVLLGENIRGIVKEVWPEISEQKDPVKYNSLLEGIRNPKSGVQIEHDSKTPPNFLNLSFANPDPERCYKVVQAVINAIKKENKRSIEEKTAAKLDFLKSQLEFYKNKLNEINKEMSGIKNDLIERFPELTERERDLIAGIGAEKTQLAKQGALETFVMYDEMLAKMNLELLEAEKKKESLERHLKTGVVEPSQRISAKDIDEDTFIKEYTKAITAKELEIATLMAQGYAEGHPEVRKVKSVIDKLEDIKKKRIKMLRTEGRGALEKDEAKEKIKNDIEEAEFDIEALKSKINLINEYRKASKEQLKPREGGKVDIYAKVERLKELEKENGINEGYYLDIRKQQEEAELRARLEREEAGFKIYVVEEPTIPLSPVSLKRVKLLVLGFMISLMVGSGLAYFVDSLDNSIRTAKELRELLEIPVLASIDTINTPQDIVMKRVRRNSIIIGLAAFVILSRIFVKLFAAIF